MACDPSTLAAESDCLQCSLSHKQILAALLYVACVEANVSPNPTTLMQQAGCILCAMTEKQILAALLYVECSGGGGGLSGVGSPQGVVTANVGQTYVDTSAGNFWVNGGGGNNTWVQVTGGSGGNAQLVTYTSGNPANPTNVLAPAIAYDPTGNLPTLGWNTGTLTWN